MLNLDLTWIEAVYWGSALVGGLLFLFRLILFFVGGVADDIPDLDVDGELGVEGVDSDASFQALSLQSLSAFFMMFGLLGLTLLSTRLHLAWTILGSLAGGLFSVWIISLIFNVVRGFQSEGTVRIQNAVGAIGTVYLQIPAGGRGQVRINIQGRSRIFDAVSEAEDTLPSGETVIVNRTIGGSTLVVQRHS